MGFPIKIRHKNKDWLIYKDGVTECEQESSPAEHIEIFNTFIAPTLKRKGDV